MKVDSDQQEQINILKARLLDAQDEANRLGNILNRIGQMLEVTSVDDLFNKVQGLIEPESEE